MKTYVKGDQVEVMRTNGALEDSWCPAFIVGVHGSDVYSVVYDGHPKGAVGAAERVSGECITPRPPLVRFEDWSRGDIMHVFDDFVWKSAIVLEVLEAKKLFQVRVIGSLKDLVVSVSSIRVRHYWQQDRWIVVGKGPSNCEAKLVDIRRYKITELLAEQRNTNALKRNAMDQIQRTRKIRRAAERTLDRSQNKGCEETVTRSKVTTKTKDKDRPPATDSIWSEAGYQMQEESRTSSVGSCNIMVKSTFNMNDWLTQIMDRAFAKDDDDISDAESCTGPCPESRNPKAIHNCPAKACRV